MNSNTKKKSTTDKQRAVKKNDRFDGSTLGFAPYTEKTVKNIKSMTKKK